MRAAVLFRGHAHRGQAEIRPHGIDWRIGLQSHFDRLIRPLEARYGACDVYLKFYDTPFLQEVVGTYSPVKWELGTPGATQRNTYADGLKMIDGDYDVVATCRFDLTLKESVIDHPNLDPAKVNFLWREWNEASWDHHRRVPDAIHVLPGVFLKKMVRAVEATDSPVCMHLVYPSVVREVGAENVNIVIREGFIDSNTDVMPNPFYQMERVRG